MARERNIVATAGQKYTVLDDKGQSVEYTVPDGMERERVEVKDKTDAQGKPIVKIHEFNTFVNHKTWLSFLAGTTEDNVKDAFNKWQYAQNLAERATVREAVAAESTVIKVDGKDVDLMALPVKSAMLAINGAMAIQAATGKEPQNAFLVARRKLVESNKLADQNGQLVLVG